MPGPSPMCGSPISFIGQSPVQVPRPPCTESASIPLTAVLLLLSGSPGHLTSTQLHVKNPHGAFGKHLPQPPAVLAGKQDSSSWLPHKTTGAQVTCKSVRGRAWLRSGRPSDSCFLLMCPVAPGGLSLESDVLASPWLLR